MTAQVNPPFGAPPVWFDVVERRAGLRCECAGQCGVGHSKTKGRCPVRHEGWHNRKTAVLTVAPSDVLRPLAQAVHLSAAELRAWCAGCLDGAKRLARIAAENAPFETDGLFDAPTVIAERGDET